MSAVGRKSPEDSRVVSDCGALTAYKLNSLNDLLTTKQSSQLLPSMSMVARLCGNCENDMQDGKNNTDTAIRKFCHTGSKSIAFQ